eukprot:1142905-Pelagomonas_calceolata.AAC.1
MDTMINEFLMVGMTRFKKQTGKEHTQQWGVVNCKFCEASTYDPIWDVEANTQQINPNSRNSDNLQAGMHGRLSAAQ